MSTRPTHISLGLTVMLLFLLYNGSFSVFYLFLPFLVLLADADHGKDLLSSKFNIFEGKLLPVPHRGPTHDLLFPFLLCLVVYFIDTHFQIGFKMREYVILYSLILAHLLGDVITVSGIKPLYFIRYFAWVIEKTNIANIKIINKFARFLYGISEWNVRTPIAYKTGANEEFVFLLGVHLLNFILSYILFLRSGPVIIENLINMIKDGNSITIGIIVANLLLIFYLFYSEFNNMRRFLTEFIGIGFSFIFYAAISVLVILLVSIGFPALTDISILVALLGFGYLIYKEAKSFSYLLVYILLFLIYVILAVLTIWYGIFKF